MTPDPDRAKEQAAALPHLREQIAVMQAFLDGKPIECNWRTSPPHHWGSCDDPIWDWEDRDYRVAPSPLDDLRVPREWRDWRKEGRRPIPDDKVCPKQVVQLTSDGWQLVIATELLPGWLLVREEEVTGKHAESWTPPRPAESLMDKFEAIVAGMTTDEICAELVARGALIEELDQPPASAAREWDALVLMCKDAIRCARDNGSYTAELDVTECQKLLDAIASVREVTPPPALTVPEGVPAPPDGFDYFGNGSLAAKMPDPKDDQAIYEDIACFNGHEWGTGVSRYAEFILVHGKGVTGRHKAIRRGTELHRRNFTP